MGAQIPRHVAALLSALGLGALALAGCAAGVGRGAPPDRAPPGFAEPLTGMEFVRVPAGTLTWGPRVADGVVDPGRPPVVEVGAFFLGRHEVTQAQWSAVMGSNPSRVRGERLPVDQVSWDDAQEFARRLTAGSGRRFRLPTEAEWEFAARSGGRDEAWPGTARAEEAGEFVWFGENAGGRAHEVGGKRPNGLGLHDLGGNVWEWCQDALGTGAAGDGGYRVLRGGSWEDDREWVRVSYRLYFHRSWVGRSVGFRLATEP